MVCIGIIMQIKAGRFTLRGVQASVALTQCAKTQN